MTEMRMRRPAGGVGVGRSRHPGEFTENGRRPPKGRPAPPPLDDRALAELAAALDRQGAALGDEAAPSPYLATPAGIIYRRPTQNGPVDQPLANFTARIVEEVIADDGVSTRSELAIEGTLAGGMPLPRVRIPANRFATLDWVVREWGARAIVAAGFGARDRLREAIQTLSPDVARRIVRVHSGWREDPDHGWVYLHAGGAIGAAGVVPGVEVSLDGVAGAISLPAPPEGEALREALRTSLALFDLAPDPITAPLLAAVYRAPLCTLAPADLALFLVGPTGVFKSELAALAMQHVGAGFDRLHLPGHWTDTPNALERSLFTFKDAPIVIDDFAPHGAPADIARLHAAADRVFRSVGNRGSRARMAADGSLRPTFPPRGMVIGTGEDAPRGQSLRARTLILEVAPGEVDRDRLTGAQRAGRAGLFAAAFAGYVRWLAPRLDPLRETLPALLADLRADADVAAAHARTPDAVAQLALGWVAFLRFAAAAGAIPEAEVAARFARAWRGLTAAAAQQAQHQQGEEPAQRFLDLLGASIAGGHAHMADLDGGPPPAAAAWGWREQAIGAGEYARTEWRPQGSRAGWVDGEALYLDPEAALAAVQRVGQATGSPIAVTPKTLAKRLHERGWLRSTEQEQGGLRVRRSIAGGRRRVLHLHMGAIYSEESGQSGQSGQQPLGPTQLRRIPDDIPLIAWPDYRESTTESSQEIRPGDAAEPS